ncbi:MAG: pantoate--beta-alanine ligase [Pseudomonadota bacterium]
MIRVETPAALAEARAALDEPVGLIPTMGALHDGHLSLIAVARAGGAKRIVATIFVNPKQFDRAEDLAAYPRDLDGDAAALAAAGVDILYAPSIAAMYPTDFATHVAAPTLTARWEGVHRPGHFDGVATVVAKLINQVRPDLSVFGEKDWQQLALIRRVAADLDLPGRILAGPTVRAPDGLALASRNLRLTPAQRTQAPALHAALQAVAAGADPDDQADGLLKVGFADVDYLALIDAAGLEPVSPQWTGAKRAIGAAWLGDVRLIDNIAA